MAIFLLLGLFCVIQAAPQLDDVSAEKTMKMYMTEFRPCDESEDNKLVFRDASFWFVNKSTIEMNCTLEVKVVIDDTAWGKIEIKKCEGGMDNCEEYPEMKCEDLCNKLFKKGTSYEPIMDKAQEHKEFSCPIQPGEYKAVNAHMTILKDAVDSAKLEAFKGELFVRFYYYLGETKIGCQHIEAMVEPDDGKKKKKGK